MTTAIELLRLKYLRRIAGNIHISGAFVVLCPHTRVLLGIQSSWWCSRCECEFAARNSTYYVRLNTTIVTVNRADIPIKWNGPQLDWLDNMEAEMAT